jgi:hypothetical protein
MIRRTVRRSIRILAEEREEENGEGSNWKDPVI